MVAVGEVIISNRSMLLLFRLFGFIAVVWKLSLTVVCLMLIYDGFSISAAYLADNIGMPVMGPFLGLKVY